MIQQSNIKIPFACWEAIKGTKVEYNLLDDGTIEHVIMNPKGFFDDENNPLEWIAARVRVPESVIELIDNDIESASHNFAKFYDKDLLEITFEV